MPRPHMTEAEVQEIWDRRARGEPLTMIARRLNRNRDWVRSLVSSAGGVRPRAHRHSNRELRFEEREEISRGVAAGASFREIGGRLCRSASTIAREVARNGGRQHYRAKAAELVCRRRHHRPKPSKLESSPLLLAKVVELLRQNWSPQQIARRLKMDFPGQAEMQVSHETIYLSLFIQSRGSLRKELTRHLRSRRTFRHPRRQLPSGKGQIPDRVLISQRPAEAADRAVPGHWEGDLLLGKPTDAIGTLVERSTRYLLLFRLPRRSTRAEAVREALAATIIKLPASLRRSLTWDQGTEMSQHVRFTVDTGVAIYFCDPNSPWQRGTNENTNGLLRQYFPKGKSLAHVSQAALDRVADELNGRPRQTLGWYKPAEKMAELLGYSVNVGGATTA
jgi:transposase, IS30 family